MCSHYEGVRDAQVLRKVFQVEPPADLGKTDLWPGCPGLLIRRPREKDSGDDAVPDREALPGLFGLVPHWATDLKICRSTYNARSETVATKPSFREAWKRAQHCIIPAQAIYDRTGAAARPFPLVSNGQTVGPWALQVCGLPGSLHRGNGCTATPC
jgi:putative SOS response-associated peptidase YedK